MFLCWDFFGVVISVVLFVICVLVVFVVVVCGGCVVIMIIVVGGISCSIMRFCKIVAMLSLLLLPYCRYDSYYYWLCFVVATIVVVDVVIFILLIPRLQQPSIAPITHPLAPPLLPKT